MICRLSYRYRFNSYICHWIVNIRIMIKKNILGLLFCCPHSAYSTAARMIRIMMTDMIWHLHYVPGPGQKHIQPTMEKTVIMYWVFYSDWTGSDYYEYLQEDILVRRTEEAFRWHWDDDNYYYPNSIYMDFPDGTYSYFEDIQIRGFQLRGILDEIDVILTME